MESEVLQENDLTAGRLLDVLLDFLANAIVQERDLLGQELLELLSNGRKRVLVGLLAIGASEVGHQDDSGCALLEGIFDRGESADNALVVGDGGAVERDVEVNLYCS